ncbi:MAG: 2Fe-2S iron-sulfur cluster binding domain-containing protein [Ruminococcaceae bacterium]|nr:2Fe-2S iron-sulfur cluster binding domain-containing protein [Oscillospiraceae bacterium]
MDTVQLKINGLEVEVPAGSTILEAAHKLGIRIPTLCYMKEINAIGACRMCLVEVKGARALAAACVYPVTNGMEVFTNTPALRKARKTTLELILSNHRMDCLSCPRNGNCELATLANEYGVDQYKYGNGRDIPVELDTSAPHLIRDNSKCILCRRCEAVCAKSQFVGVIGANERGFKTHIGSAFEMGLNETACINCGQCITVCPVGALTPKDDTAKVWDALADPTKHVVVGPAPSVRAQLGECFGMPMGTNVEGKMVAALRRLGFDKVFDVDTAADVTIMEEGTELLERIKNGGQLPLITSCSPGWVRFAETYYPEFIPNISSCKSPQQMYGALMKTYYAEKAGIDPKDIFVVSVMPCTAKKFEIGRDNQNASGYADIDVSITTVELASMIKRAGLQFTALPDEEFDPAFGVASGAGHIFGATGGVMEAALRTVYEVVTGETAPSVDYTEVRGTKDIKEATYNIGGMEVNVAVTSGLANAAKLLDSVKSGEKNYHFIEVMGCPGGCVNGGGQPDVPGYVRNFVDVRAERAKALYSEDAAMTLRKSHENPVVKEIYDTFLGQPGSHKAHELLHTTYVERKIY